MLIRHEIKATTRSDNDLKRGGEKCSKKRKIIDTRTRLSNVKHQIPETRLKIDMRLDFEFTRFHLLFTHLKLKLKINSSKKKRNRHSLISSGKLFQSEFTGKRLALKRKFIPVRETETGFKKRRDCPLFLDRISFLSCLLFLCCCQSEKRNSQDTQETKRKSRLWREKDHLISKKCDYKSIFSTEILWETKERK